MNEKYQQRLHHVLIETQQHLAKIPPDDVEAYYHLQHKLVRIQQAQQRLQAGRFGLCQQCGQALRDARLEVLVYAELCLSCQKAQEKLK